MTVTSSGPDAGLSAGTALEPGDLDEREALSTQPAAVEPYASEHPAGDGAAAVRQRPRRTPVAWVRLGWRRLTSMRTALQLLFILSLAAVPGGLLPQRGQEPQRVATYLTTHRTLGPILDHLSLFDVFAAPWFAAIYLLLFVSLIGCLGPRIVLHAKALGKKPPAVPARLSRLRSYDSWTTAASPAAVAEAGAAGLRGWRVAREPGAVRAERGYLRETGNLVFHVALVVLLAGVALGSVFGYESDTVLAQGQGYTDTPIQLDQFRPGKFVSAGDLPPWTFHLDTFDASYYDTGTPKTYDAKATFTPAGGSPRKVDVEVNHPLSLGSGAKLYLLNHGYAVSFALTGRHLPGAANPDAVTSLTSEPVICSPLAPTTLLSRCQVSFAGLPKAADGSDADLAFDVTFAPTGQVDPTSGITSTFPSLENPDALVTPYVGNLGTPSQVGQLDYRLLTPVTDAKTKQVRVTNLVVRNPSLNTLANLPGGYSLTVAKVVPWASFQVKRDPAKRLVLVAALGIVGGLLLSLRVRRRRLWVRGTPGPDGRTLVEVGGLARSDAVASAEEFDRIVVGLRERLPAAAPPAPTDPTAKVPE